MYQPGPARQDHESTPRVNGGSGSSGSRGVAPGTVTDVWRHDVKHMVRHFRTLLCGGLRRPNIHVPINLHRVRHSRSHRQIAGNSATARLDFPEAVGPVTTTTGRARPSLIALC